MLVVKRDFPADQDVKHYPKAPNIDFWAGVGFSIEEFWSRKIQRATKRVQVGGRVVKIGKAKIDDFDVSGFGNENVLNLEVYTGRLSSVKHKTRIRETDLGELRYSCGSIPKLNQSGVQTCVQHVHGAYRD
jgi:hypothetical protein